jgi:hypothetical protein
MTDETKQDKYRDPIKPLGTDEELDKTKISTSFLLSSTRHYMEENAGKHDNIPMDNTLEAYEHLTTLRESSNHEFGDSEYLGHQFDREESEWVQAVEHNGEQLGISSRVPTPTHSKLVKGSASLEMFNLMTKGGDRIDVPLWRSGFWVTIRTPKNSEIFRFEQKIANEQMSVSNALDGNNLSLRQGSIIKAIMELFDSIFITSTMKDVKNIKKHIKLTDLYQLVNSMAVAIHVRGFNVNLPCTADLQKCSHVVKGKVNLNLLSLTDRSRLTEEQLTHMAIRSDRYGVDEVKKYQNKHVHGAYHTFEVYDNVKLRLEEPSIHHFLEMHDQRIAHLTSIVDSSLDADASEGMRINRMDKSARSLEAQEWSHWVAKLTMGEEDAYVDEDPVSISMVLAEGLSSDRKYVVKLREEVNALINDCVLTVIGVPIYKCPECGNIQESHKAYKNLKPINPITHFFGIAQRFNSSLTEGS